MSTQADPGGKISLSAISLYVKGQVYLRFRTLFYYIPRSEILEFPSVINLDIITSDDINFHFLS